MKNPEDSVSEWIAGMKAGDADATASLWNRYFDRICRFAQKKLGNARVTVVDKDDLAINALNAIWTGALEGRFRKLENRDDLWQLLVVITSRQAANVHRKQRTRREVGESALLGSGVLSNQFADILQAPPAKSMIDDVPSTCGGLLEMLDEKLQEVALMRLAGYTNLEIAEMQDCSVKTIERCMKQIRNIWSKDFE